MAAAAEVAKLRLARRGRRTGRRRVKDMVLVNWTDGGGREGGFTGGRFCGRDDVLSNMDG